MPRSPRSRPDRRATRRCTTCAAAASAAGPCSSLVGAGLPGHAGLVACWRLVGQAAAGLRDIAAMETTVADLLHAAPPLAAVEGAGVAGHLTAFRVQARRTLHSRLGALAVALTSARARVAEWRPAFSWTVALEGLVEGYRRSHRAARAAWRHPDADARHTWRKRAKAHALQVRLLAPLWPAMMSAWRSQWDELAQRLGDEHDLHVLTTFLAALPRPDRASGLMGMAEHRAAGMRCATDELGRRLHAESAAGLERRVRAYARCAALC